MGVNVQHGHTHHTLYWPTYLQSKQAQSMIWSSVGKYFVMSITYLTGGVVGGGVACTGPVLGLYWPPDEMCGL